MGFKVFFAAVMLSANVAALADTTGITVVDGNVFAGMDSSAMSYPEASGTITETGSSAGSNSTVTAAASSSQITVSFSQTYGAPDTSSVGSSAVDFTAAAGTSYSITDPMAVFMGSGYDFVDANLSDRSSGFILYDTDGFGSLTGVLAAGDEYEFQTYASIVSVTDPSLTYAPSISFTTASVSATPEPSGLLLLGTGLVGMAGVVRRRLGGMR